MNIVYSDDYNKLTEDVKRKMEQAVAAAIRRETEEKLAPYGIKSEEAAIEISLSVVSDDEIRELNRDYRYNDKVTDVLSFPQFEGAEDVIGDIVNRNGCTTLLGDVVICYDQVIRQAEEYGTGEEREIIYLLVHSLMHLFGYDHEDEDDKREMREHEEAVLNEIGIYRDHR